jgi:hypothetical protein
VCRGWRRAAPHRRRTPDCAAAPGPSTAGVIRTGRPVLPRQTAGQAPSRPVRPPVTHGADRPGEPCRDNRSAGPEAVPASLQPSDMGHCGCPVPLRPVRYVDQSVQLGRSQATRGRLRARIRIDSTPPIPLGGHPTPLRRHPRLLSRRRDAVSPRSEAAESPTRRRCAGDPHVARSAARLRARLPLVRMWSADPQLSCPACRHRRHPQARPSRTYDTCRRWSLARRRKRVPPLSGSTRRPQPTHEKSAAFWCGRSRRC